MGLPPGGFLFFSVGKVNLAEADGFACERCIWLSRSFDLMWQPANFFLCFEPVDIAAVSMLRFALRAGALKCSFILPRCSGRQLFTRGESEA